MTQPIDDPAADQTPHDPKPLLGQSTSSLESPLGNPLSGPAHESAMALPTPAVASEPEMSSAAVAPVPAALSAAVAPEPEPDPDPDLQPARSTDARLARLHLRGGLLTLARAELEQMAGAGTLDREALADLAESRWRSGDLDGANEAAQAHLANGGSEPIASLIVAESMDRHGHLLDARAQAAPLVASLGPGVDRLFAGEPRGPAWPVIDGAQMFTDANDAGRRGLLVAGMETANADAIHWEPAQPPAPLVDRRSPVTSQTGTFAARGAMDAWSRNAGTQPGRPTGTPAPVGPSASIRELVDAGRAAGLELEAVEHQVELGDLDEVPDRLALLLRMDRALAPVILSLADRVVASSQGDEARLASLHMLRGDIYRGLGRDVEATAAYQEAMRAVAPRAAIEESS